ncbi:MAG: hypothetical protein KIT13_06390 [Burkholderiales bacterium]|nr:hypothetical protein [Burkholderiales bacterium]
MASTPAIGFQFTPHYQSGDSILHALGPLFDKQHKGLKQRFTIEVHESFRVQFVMEEGFQYFFDASKVVVEFKHRLRVKAQSGGPPTAQLITTPRPYTELLPEVVGRAIEAVELVYAKARTLKRIGIVTTTSLALGDAPPGIGRFLNYIGHPWSGKMDFFNMNLMTVLAETDEHKDLCLHTFNKPEDDEQLPSVKLDWLREYKIQRQATSDVLKKQASVAQESALKYFEEIGEGGRFDEYINRNTK